MHICQKYGKSQIFTPLKTPFSDLFMMSYQHNLEFYKIKSFRCIIVDISLISIMTLNVYIKSSIFWKIWDDMMASQPPKVGPKGEKITYLVLTYCKFVYF